MCNIPWYGHGGVLKLLLGVQQVISDLKDSRSWAPLSVDSGRGHEAALGLLLRVDRSVLTRKALTVAHFCLQLRGTVIREWCSCYWRLSRLVSALRTLAVARVFRRPHCGHEPVAYIHVIMTKPLNPAQNAPGIPALDKSSKEISNSTAAICHSRWWRWGAEVDLGY